MVSRAARNFRPPRSAWRIQARSSSAFGGACALTLLSSRFAEYVRFEPVFDVFDDDDRYPEWERAMTAFMEVISGVCREFQVMVQFPGITYIA